MARLMIVEGWLLFPSLSLCLSLSQSLKACCLGAHYAGPSPYSVHALCLSPVITYLKLA